MIFVLPLSGVPIPRGAPRDLSTLLGSEHQREIWLDKNEPQPTNPGTPFPHQQKLPPPSILPLPPHPSITTDALPTACLPPATATASGQRSDPSNHQVTGASDCRGCRSKSVTIPLLRVSTHHIRHPASTSVPIPTAIKPLRYTHSESPSILGRECTFLSRTVTRPLSWQRLGSRLVGSGSVVG